MHSKFAFFSVHLLLNFFVYCGGTEKMVGVFARFFRQLIPNDYKDKNTRSKTNRDKKRSQSIALKNFNSSSTATSSSSISSSQRVTKSTATIDTSYSQQQQSSREGKSFKYNEDGRRYHGIDEIAYILPNDDDGTAIYEQTRCHLVQLFNSAVAILIYRDRSPT